MTKKAAVSFPMTVVVSIVIILVILVLVFMLVENVGDLLIKGFSNVIKQGTLFVGGLLGPLG